MNLQKGREQPQGGSLSLSSSFQKAADVSNITFRDSRMLSHQITDHLQDQLLSAGQRGSISAPASRHHSGNKSSHSGLYVTPAGEDVMHVPDLQRVLWSSGRLTAADGFILELSACVSIHTCTTSHETPTSIDQTLTHSLQTRGCCFYGYILPKQSLQNWLNSIVGPKRSTFLSHSLSNNSYSS